MSHLLPELSGENLWRLQNHNQRATETDTYPLPRIEDLFASLARGKIFSKLDLAHAYQQIGLSEESKQYTWSLTHTRGSMRTIDCCLG